MPGRHTHPVRRLVPVGDPGSGRDGDAGTTGPPPIFGSAVASGSVLSWRSRASALSAGSFASVLSAGSFASLLSAGSALSAASFLSVGSVGSILSIGSSGSILSIGSSGSVLSIGAAGGFLQIGRPPATTPSRDLTALVTPLATSAHAVLAGATGAWTSARAGRPSGPRPSSTAARLSWGVSRVVPRPLRR